MLPCPAACIAICESSPRSWRRAPRRRHLTGRLLSDDPSGGRIQDTSFGPGDVPPPFGTESRRSTFNFGASQRTAHRGQSSAAPTFPGTDHSTGPLDAISENVPAGPHTSASAPAADWWAEFNIPQSLGCEYGQRGKDASDNDSMDCCMAQCPTTCLKIPTTMGRSRMTSPSRWTWSRGPQRGACLMGPLRAELVPSDMNNRTL